MDLEFTSPASNSLDQASESDLGIDSPISEGLTLDEAISLAGFGAFQIRILLIANLSWAADAMEVLLLSFLIPEVQKEWNLPEGYDGLLGAIVFLGFLAGNYFWGILADVHGRRSGFLALSSICGGFGILSAASWSIQALLFFRFAVGFGLGASPVAYTLVSEFLPTSHRAKVLALSSVFWSVGAIVEVGLAWITIPSLGWRWFLVFSSLPMIIVFFLLPLIPESPHFLLISGKTEAAEALILQMMIRNRGAAALEHMSKIKLQPHTVAKTSGLAHLKKMIHPSFRTTTILVWICWFANSFVYYGITFLTPRFFSSSDGEVDFMSSFIATLAELPAVALSFLMVSFINRKSSLVILYAGCSIFLVMVISLFNSNTLPRITLFGARLFISAAFSITYLYTSEVYPTSIRTTAVGSSSAISRIAGMCTSFISEDIGTITSTIIFASVVFLSAIAASRLKVETRSKDLMEDDPISEIELSRKISIQQRFIRQRDDGDF